MACELTYIFRGSFEPRMKRARLSNYLIPRPFQLNAVHTLEKRTCEANAAGENSSFIFTLCVNVVLQMAVKEFFEAHF